MEVCIWRGMQVMSLFFVELLILKVWEVKIVT